MKKAMGNTCSKGQITLTRKKQSADLSLPCKIGSI
jgi:hypothetical protein